MADAYTEKDVAKDVREIQDLAQDMLDCFDDYIGSRKKIFKKSAEMLTRLWATHIDLLGKDNKASLQRNIENIREDVAKNDEQRIRMVIAWAQSFKITFSDAMNTEKTYRKALARQRALRRYRSRNRYYD